MIRGLEGSCSPKNAPPERGNFRGRERFAALVLAVFAALAPCVAQAGSVSYTYDILGRLSKVIYNDGKTATTIAYSYDAAGNRTSVATTSAAVTAAART